MRKPKKSPKKSAKKPAKKRKQKEYKFASFVPPPTWTDAYGNTRPASAMTTDHLFNVLGYIRGHEVSWMSFVHKRRQGLPDFYWSAVEELKNRGWL